MINKNYHTEKQASQEFHPKSPLQKRPKKRQYREVNLSQKLNFINDVLNHKYDSITIASEQHGIDYSNAKAIIRKYRKEGKIGLKTQRQSYAQYCKNFNKNKSDEYHHSIIIVQQPPSQVEHQNLNNYDLSKYQPTYKIIKNKLNNFYNQNYNYKEQSNQSSPLAQINTQEPQYLDNLFMINQNLNQDANQFYNSCRDTKNHLDFQYQNEFLNNNQNVFPKENFSMQDNRQFSKPNLNYNYYNQNIINPVINKNLDINLNQSQFNNLNSPYNSNNIESNLDSVFEKLKELNTILQIINICEKIQNPQLQIMFYQILEEKLQKIQKIISDSNSTDSTDSSNKRGINQQTNKIPKNKDQLDILDNLLRSNSSQQSSNEQGKPINQKIKLILSILNQLIANDKEICTDHHNKKQLSSFKQNSRTDNFQQEILDKSLYNKKDQNNNDLSLKLSQNGRQKKINKNQIKIQRPTIDKRNIKKVQNKQLKKN